MGGATGGAGLDPDRSSVNPEFGLSGRWRVASRAVAAAAQDRVNECVYATLILRVSAALSLRYFHKSRTESIKEGVGVSVGSTIRPPPLLACICAGQRLAHVGAAARAGPLP